MSFDLAGDIFGKPKRRIPVKQGTRTSLLADAGAKCQRCHKSPKGLKPHIHHKDGNPKNNKKSNLKVLCPNCHSHIHTKSIKRKPKGNEGVLGFGFP